ncbi:MAG: hypothetical protein N3A01_07460 [Bacteroidales bacterium]|nr:hypothetical protein [Bacteroidales bacterium]
MGFILFLLILITLTTHSNEYYIVRKIIITGNKKTKNKVILREIPFKEGDTISSVNIKKFLQITEDNLRRTALFNFVYIDTINTFNNSTDVVINVVERWYFWPVPIFEQASRNINAWIYEKDFNKINFGLFLLQANFRGNNELLRGIVTFGFREKYGFAYTIPEFLKSKKLGFEFKALHYQQKKVPYKVVNNKPVYFFYENNYLYRNEDIEITIKYRPYIHYSHNFIVSFENHRISDTLYTLNKNFLIENNKKISFLNFSYIFSFNNTNSFSFPTRGIKYQLHLSIDKFINNYFNNPSFLGSISSYAPICKRLNFANGLYFKYSFLKKQTYLFSKCLGYKYFVRGMELYEIPGDGFILNSNSLRYNVLNIKEKNLNFIKNERFSKFFFSLFLSINADVGYVISYHKMPLTNEVLYGYGIGINFVTYYDVALKVDYSINKFNEKKIFIHFLTFI